MMGDHQSMFETLMKSQSMLEALIKSPTYSTEVHACAVCDAKFHNKHSLKLHTRIHTGAMPFSCKVCGKRFTGEHLMRKHTERVQEERRFVCGSCHKAFCDRRGLKRHMTIHTVSDCFSCSVCGVKGFISKLHFEEHHQTHTNEKPFECEICGKNFKTESSLEVHNMRTHQRSHTNDKPFECEICGKTFQIEATVKVHKWTVHNVKVSYCSVCRRTFHCFLALNTHFKFHTRPGAEPGPSYCFVCGEHTYSPFFPNRNHVLTLVRNLCICTRSECRRFGGNHGLGQDPGESCKQFSLKDYLTVQPCECIQRPVSDSDTIEKRDSCILCDRDIPRSAFQAVSLKDNDNFVSHFVKQSSTVMPSHEIDRQEQEVLAGNENEDVYLFCQSCASICSTCPLCNDLVSFSMLRIHIDLHMGESERQPCKIHKM